MSMLAAGGIEPLTDRRRQADENNPKGYYEFERVKQLKTDTGWLPLAKGKAVKVISMLLEHLPPEHHYKVIFMERDMQEVLASQMAMLQRDGKDGGSTTDEILGEKFRLHLERVRQWLARQPNFDVLYIGYREVLKNRRRAAIHINRFLDNRLDVEQMYSTVDQDLYRQRR